jgi:hypothetical protein
MTFEGRPVPESLLCLREREPGAITLIPDNCAAPLSP